MNDIAQIEQEYELKRREIERDYRIKLQKLAEDDIDILSDIRYEGKAKDKINNLLEREYQDRLTQLAYDKARDMGEIEVE
jgi:hypothetical protein